VSDLPWEKWSAIKKDIDDTGVKSSKIFSGQSFGKTLEEHHALLYTRLHAADPKNDKETKALAKVAANGKKLTAQVEKAAKKYAKALEAFEKPYDKGQKEMPAGLSKALANARAFLNDRTSYSKKLKGFDDDFWDDGPTDKVRARLAKSL